MRLVRWLPVAAAAGLLAWILLLPDDWENWLGFSQYDYFKAGTNYAFTSGPGPMLLTAIGMSTIVAGLWRVVNCHVDGCPKIGRYHIAGGRFKVCRTHHPEEVVQQGKVGHHHIIAWHREHSP